MVLGDHQGKYPQAGDAQEAHKMGANGRGPITPAVHIPEAHNANRRLRPEIEQDQTSQHFKGQTEVFMEDDKKQRGEVDVNGLAN